MTVIHALLHDVREGDTVTIQLPVSTLVYANIRAIERYSVLGRAVAIDITDESGSTFTSDENRPVLIERRERVS